MQSGQKIKRLHLGVKGIPVVAPPVLTPVTPVLLFVPEVDNCFLNVVGTRRYRIAIEGEISAKTINTIVMGRNHSPAVMDMRKM